MVADNTVDFSVYPARQACKNIGGRLPNIHELVAIYNAQSSYGDNFVPTNYYWASAEYRDMYSSGGSYVNFANGNVSSIANWRSLGVRCVL